MPEANRYSKRGSYSIRDGHYAQKVPFCVTRGIFTPVQTT
jgi:hypothetical protein